MIKWMKVLIIVIFFFKICLRVVEVVFGNNSSTSYFSGFPYWPAKAMCTNNSGMVDVRFFGAHDRAWVPLKECFLYSRRDPNSNKQKRNDIIECMRVTLLKISFI